MPTVCYMESTNNDAKEKKKKREEKTKFILSWWQFFPEVSILLWNFACKRQIKNSGWLSRVPASLATKALEHLCHQRATRVSSGSATAPEADTTPAPRSPCQHTLPLPLAKNESREAGDAQILLMSPWVWRSVTCQSSWQALSCCLALLEGGVRDLGNPGTEVQPSAQNPCALQVR